jgi:hypothetical protein
MREKKQETIWRLRGGMNMKRCLKLRIREDKNERDSIDLRERRELRARLCDL